MELNLKNLKEAFCKVLACTGIGAAEKDWEGLLERKISIVVPQSMQADFPERILACSIDICTNAPYGWSVDQEVPDFTAKTTFADLLDDWFKEIVWPA